MQTSSITTLTTDGQVTLPEETREFLKIEPGDEVEFFLHSDGYAAMRPVNSMKKLRGMVKWSGEPVTIEEMDEAVGKALAERDLRVRSGQ